MRGPIQIYADCASVADIQRLAEVSIAGRGIAGFTTNPTLMRRAGVTNYKDFARGVLAVAGNKPVSFEVLSDDFGEMFSQAITLSDLGPNVYVKIPITNSAGVCSLNLIRRLTSQKIKVNVTAITTATQVYKLARVLDPGVPAIVSVFAGRIADAGVGPKKIMEICRSYLPHEGWQLLWASTREVYNIMQAERCGCDIITVPPDILDKAAKTIGRDLEQISKETVAQFVRDAAEAGYEL